MQTYVEQQLNLVRHFLKISMTLCLLGAVLSLLAMQYAPASIEEIVWCGTPDPIKREANLTGVELAKYQEGEQLFKANCAACHKLDKEIIGPALAQVSQKYEKEWLYQWIRNSQKLIKSGDEQAIALFDEYDNSIMPAFPTLSDENIEGILFYLGQ